MARTNLTDERMERYCELEDISRDFVNETDFNTYYNDWDLYDALEDFADGRVDVYNDDLLEWAKSNVHWIDEANDMCGYEPYSFMEQIAHGQFYYYDAMLTHDSDKIFEIAIIEKLQSLGITNVDSEKFSKIMSIAFKKSTFPITNKDLFEAVTEDLDEIVLGFDEETNTAEFFGESIGIKELIER